MRIRTKAARALLLALLLGVLSTYSVMAQDRGGRRGGVGGFGDPLDGPQQEEQAGQRQQDPYAEESIPFLHGIYLGAGVNLFQGDFSSNPNNNILKHLGSAELNVLAGADKRFGAFEQYSLGAELEYNFLSGQQVIGQSFSTHTLSLDVMGNYDIPFVSQNLLRIFAGVGPMFIIAPSYDGFPTEQEQEDLRSRESDEVHNGRMTLGTRVTGAAKVGHHHSRSYPNGACVSRLQTMWMAIMVLMQVGLSTLSPRRLTWAIASTCASEVRRVTEEDAQSGNDILRAKGRV